MVVPGGELVVNERGLVAGVRSASICYALATRCPVLSWGMICDLPTSSLCNARYCDTACCYLPGTDIEHAATGLSACYAVCGTELGYGATRK
eukprot:299750-Rhodomonas_salina.3